MKTYNKYKPYKKHKSSEHLEQVAFFKWCKDAIIKYPELSLIYAVPNGGMRHKAVAKKLKAEGVKSGVPDIHLPISNGRYIGLWLEMKYKYNKPSEEQSAWLSVLEYVGHCCTVCYSAQDAIDAVEDYFENTNKG